MNIKNKVTRVAIAGLTIGALAAAGLGAAGTAFADGDGLGAPDTTTGDTGLTVGPRPQVIYVYVTPDTTPVPTIDPNYIYLSYPVTPVYPAYSYSTQNQGLFVTGTAEVMGVDVNTILGQLSLGRSLTQIAADRGWPRDYFLSLLVNRVQSDLIYGINNGTIDPTTGNALLTNLVSQASYAIDEVGTPSYTPQSIYGVFPVAPY